MLCLRATLITFLVVLPSHSWALAPFLGAESPNSISNSYIVVLRPEITREDFASHLAWADSHLRTSGSSREFTYDFGNFRGYSTSITQSTALLLAASGQVDYIEANQRVRSASQERSAKQGLQTTQPNAPYNLARISHRNRGSTDYVYNDTSSVDVYVLDTGVRITHQSFQGRASYGWNVANQPDDDRIGHGTHVAGIVASAGYGVAKQARIISVKVLVDGASQTSAGTIAGINWAANDVKKKGTVNYAAALLGVTSAYSGALNSAVANASSAGLFFAVPAGNDNSDASNVSPSSETSACVVGAIDSNDKKAQYTNYGRYVDLFAPGNSILSTSRQNDTSTISLSGTAQSAAHVAGLGAYFLAKEGPRTPVALCERLRQIATRDAITGLGGLANTANLLAYNDSGL